MEKGEKRKQIFQEKKIKKNQKNIWKKKGKKWEKIEKEIGEKNEQK